MEEKKTTALAPVQAGMSIYDRIADPLVAIERMGKWFRASGMFGVKTDDQGMILAMACIHERANPLDIIRRYHIIQGRLSMRADAMQAEFQSRGGRIKWIESTSEGCRAILSHPEYCPDGLEVMITLKEMKEKGAASSDTWTKWPRQMLRARVISEGVRAVDPSICAGAYTPEEIESFADRGNGGVQRQRSLVETKEAEPMPPMSASEAEARLVDDLPPEPEQKAEPPKRKANGRAQKAVEVFAKLGVSKENLERYVGEFNGSPDPINMDIWTPADLNELLGVYETISGSESRDEKIAQIFGG